MMRFLVNWINLKKSPFLQNNFDSIQGRTFEEEELYIKLSTHNYAVLVMAGNEKFKVKRTLKFPFLFFSSR